MLVCSPNVASGVPAYLMQINADYEFPYLKPSAQPYFSSECLSWASAAAQTATTSQPAIINAAKRGITTSACNIKPVLRLLTAFAEAKDNCVTESDLQEILQNVSIEDASCRKLIPKEGKTSRTAAFRVSCNNNYKNLIYSMDN